MAIVPFHLPFQGRKMEANWLGYKGSSKIMESIHRRIHRAALGDIPVFLIGESGVGKEIYARALHHLGSRSQHPYLAFNCATFTQDLAQSELFGHERGAFTGAMQPHSGIVERANRGTLFLDEICDMHPHVQAKLLRFAEDGSYHRLGGRSEKRTNVRLICATNHDPETAIRRGQLRADLFHRLHGVPLRIPPLRERREDIPILARHFLLERDHPTSFTGFTPSAQNFLCAAPWPGNVRQLKNVLDAVCVMETGKRINVGMLEPYITTSIRSLGGITSLGPSLGSNPSLGESCLPAPFDAASLPPSPLIAQAPMDISSQDSRESLRESRHRMIEQALAICGFNVTRASAMLGVHPSTIYRYRAHRPRKRT